NGGYVQIYKLGPRRCDGAEMALIRLVAKEAAVEGKKAEEAPAEEKAEA
ncbi:MAG: 50S ribosomal protein L17, partial [Clostridia bacterium]|nr:50S ribosomal protein L17 [Clostridia bacterium]